MICQVIISVIKKLSWPIQFFTYLFLKIWSFDFRVRVKCRKPEDCSGFAGAETIPMLELNSLYETMPHRCVVGGCGNTTNTNAGVSVHKWPKPPYDRLWMKAVQTTRSDFTPSATSMICSIHFEEIDHWNNDLTWNLTSVCCSGNWSLAAASTR